MARHVDLGRAMLGTLYVSLWGFPTGLGLWIFYRLVRFAVKDEGAMEGTATAQSDLRRWIAREWLYLLGGLVVAFLAFLFFVFQSIAAGLFHFWTA